MAMIRFLSAFFLLSVLSGCYFSPPVADGWTGEHDDALLTDLDRDQQPRLQVFIHYLPWLSTHSVMRVTTPGKVPLIWDPGGSYGEQDPTLERRADVLLGRGVSLEEWWRWRWDGCDEWYLMVYEWDLPEATAAQWHQFLIDRQEAPDDPGTFQTATLAGRCSLNLTRFLIDFGDPHVTAPRRYLWPATLGQHLWSQNPDRVLVVSYPDSVRVYTAESAPVDPSGEP